MFKKVLIFFLLIFASFFLGTQFHKQEICPFGKGYYHVFKMIKNMGLIIKIL